MEYTRTQEMKLGIEVPVCHHKPQARAAKDIEIHGAVPVGLGDNAHPVAMAFQNPGNHRRPKGGMIHIDVPRN